MLPLPPLLTTVVLIASRDSPRHEHVLKSNAPAVLRSPAFLSSTGTTSSSSRSMLSPEAGSSCRNRTGPAQKQV